MHKKAPEADIGVVSYTNALPLIHKLTGYTLYKNTPTKIAKDFQQGYFRAALLPVYEIFQTQNLWIIDKIAIGARDGIDSVSLFLRKKRHELKHIGLDSNSRTSSHLVQLLMKEYYKQELTYEFASPEELRSQEKYDAYLLIGDNALAHNKDTPHIDLAQIWHEWTALPFVFAAWGIRSPNKEIKAALTKAKEQGVAEIEKIIAAQGAANPKALRQYYKQLHFELAEEEKQALKTYQKKLYEAKLLAQERELRYY